MPNRTFVGRVITPSLYMGLPLAMAWAVYFHASLIHNQFLHKWVALGSGLIMFLTVFLGVVVVYPAAYMRGAGPMERILAGLIVPLVFAGYETYVVSEFFTVAESFYFLLNPAVLIVFVLAIGLMGICELACRVLVRRPSGQRKVLTWAPVLAIAVMIIGVYVLFFWENGTRFFYLYMDSYLNLFKS